MRFCTLTLGCKVNQYETQAMESLLISRGHTKTEPGSGCDVCVINTCAVTSESSRKSRQAVRRMRTKEPDALIAVCGCMTQLEPELRDRLGADLTGGSGGRREFTLEIERLWEARQAGGFENPQPPGGFGEPQPSGGFEEPQPPNGFGEPQPSGGFGEPQPSGGFMKLQPPGGFGEPQPSGGFEEPQPSGGFENPQPPNGFEELPPGSSSGRTRALLKIQDGCDNFCTYCVIPFARGRVRSLPPLMAAEYALLLAKQGYREIVITGIEISSYGKDLAQNIALPDVVSLIADAAKGVRIRLSSLDPGFVTKEFCDALAAIPDLCGHFHLSLQSGCDDTLRRMGRKYDTRAVKESIELLRTRFPNCGITSDLITGFPGETSGEFEQTMEFITAAEFSGMHIFPFSPRPGTGAAVMQGQVAKNIRIERAGMASSVAETMAEAFRQKQIGNTLSVLFEREKAGAIIGHSENYIEVAVKKTSTLNGKTSIGVVSGESGGEQGKSITRNSIHSVQINAVDKGFVWAEIV